MEARQRAKIFLVLLLAWTTYSCSKQDWLSNIYLFRAEEASSKAYLLRLKKGVTYGERLKLYAQACDLFLKAYRYSDRTFTLNRIGSAAESCLRVNDYEAEGKFREFEARYIKAHPQETEYGDAVPLMNLE